jgi:hypothetical protein
MDLDDLIITVFWLVDEVIPHVLEGQRLRPIASAGARANASG